MNKFGGKFALIVGLTLLGLCAIWPPEEKLKTGHRPLGRDDPRLRGQQGRHRRPNFNLDELITALKRRINPEGVQDIPIRKIGSNRIEIILPKASAEEVEEVKRKMTDVGSLEFRILANHKHDAGVDRPGPGPERAAPSPPRSTGGPSSARRSPARTRRSTAGDLAHRPAQRLGQEPYAGPDGRT